MKHANKAEYINEICMRKQTNMFELETMTQTRNSFDFCKMSKIAAQR